MNRLNTLFKFFLALLGTGFFALILYVSILGENHKIDYQVTRFFEDLKQKNYGEVCDILARTPNSAPMFHSESCLDTCFLLELSFLSLYGLLDQPDYSVAVQRDPFWIPFVSKDTVSVSIALTQKKNNLIEKLFHGVDDTTFVQDFMTVTRSKGTWKITAINLVESDLNPVFDAMKEEVDLNRFIVPTKQGFAFRESTISPHTLSPLDRRVLDFSLSKLKLDRED